MSGYQTCSVVELVIIQFNVHGHEWVHTNLVHATHCKKWHGSMHTFIASL